MKVERGVRGTDTENKVKIYFDRSLKKCRPNTGTVIKTYFDGNFKKMQRD